MNKGFEPYWTIYKEKHGIKLNNIIAITIRFEELLSIYPDLRINGIGDYFTYELDYYNNCSSFSNKDAWIKKPTFDYDIFGIEIDKFSNASYRPSTNVILINHNSFLLEYSKDVNLMLSQSLTHEFAHALDEQYRIFENYDMNILFEKYKDDSNSMFSKNADSNIREFIAEGFEKSFYSDSQKANEVRMLMNRIINSC